MKGKICLVTGASSGIGLGTVLQLVKRGARVIMASRPGEKADRAFQEARRRAAYSGAEVEWLPIDLASFSSIERFVREFEKRWPRLNALFNCAGVQYLKRVETTAGLEAMLAVNYLGHFLLTNLLYTRLKAGQPAVVITVSGRGHKRT
ncbi:MAG: short-chain dehydrogenase, partial [Candidatus Aminicenantes bacterium]